MKDLILFRGAAVLYSDLLQWSVIWILASNLLTVCVFSVWSIFFLKPKDKHVPSLSPSEGWERLQHIHFKEFLKK